MKKRITFLFFLCLTAISTISLAENPKNTHPKIILLIAEQNIQGKQHAWWVTEVDLSTTEVALARKLMESGFEVIEPLSLAKALKKDRAFRLLNLSEARSIKLGNLSKANFVVLGKAVASAGGKVQQSNMISCFANITVKLIRLKDAKVIAYLDASGKSVHLDEISGGREALNNAAQDLAVKLIEVLNKPGGSNNEK